MTYVFPFISIFKTEEMMKKLLCTMFALFAFSLGASANEADDVMKVFDEYVKDANSYSTSLPNYYVNGANIIRVVNKKQGGQKAVIIPYDRYLKELNGHSTLAKTVRYTNRYVNRKVQKQNADYKLTAMRIPRNDKIGLPSYFVFTKSGNTWKIKEESMTTNVQAFLNAK